MENDLSLEHELIRRILAGEHQLFHDLIRPHERRVYLSALAVLQNEADTEEASQEALLKAFTHLHQFRFEAKFSTWLISIAINEARQRIRSGAKVREESLDAESEDQPVSPALLADWKEIPLASLEQMELRHQLRRAVEELPVIYREVFTARDIDGLGVSDTAQALGVTATAVKVRLHRARMMLQRKLAPYLKGSVSKARRLPWF